MKKSIVFILSMLFVSAFANAQITIMPYVQGNLSYANPQIELTSVDSEYKSKFGYASGVLINYELNDVLEIRTGLEYQNMGFNSYHKLKNDDPNYHSTWTYIGIGKVDSLSHRVRQGQLNN